MELVIIESPHAAKWWWTRFANACYARACLKESFERGEAPIVSHLLYSQVLDADDPGERQWAVAAGLAWAKGCRKAGRIYRPWDQP